MAVEYHNGASNESPWSGSAGGHEEKKSAQDPESCRGHLVVGRDEVATREQDHRRGREPAWVVFNTQARVYEEKAKPKGNPAILGHLIFCRSHKDEKGAKRNKKDKPPQLNASEETEYNPEHDP
jgi:hypothetical protein